MPSFVRSHSIETVMGPTEKKAAVGETGIIGIFPKFGEPDLHSAPAHVGESTPSDKETISLEQFQERGKLSCDSRGSPVSPEKWLQRLRFDKISSNRSSTFSSIQKWEGVVERIEKDFFSARLSDLTYGKPQENVEIPLDMVQDEDRSLMGPGAVFYWNIGYKIEKLGKRTTSSLIMFRRLPVWRKEEIQRARKKAGDFAKKLGWE